MHSYYEIVQIVISTFNFSRFRVFYNVREQNLEYGLKLKKKEEVIMIEKLDNDNKNIINVEIHL